jgi:hypothetical protein
MSGKIPFAAALGLLVAAAAYGKSELFQRLALETDAGYVFPLGNLGRVLDPVPAAGLRLTSSYYRDFRAHIFLGYSRFKAGDESIPTTFETAGIGVEWHGLPARPP